MAYVAVENFSKGLDSRHEQIAGEPGSLFIGENMHISRGGNIQRRKKFVSTYDVTDTFGFHVIGETRYVFGSTADPGVPVGITYQRLQHPDGSTAMSDIVWTASFDGKVYVIAEFTGGDVYHFYDGTIVDDWLNGIVRTDMTDNDGVAEHLKDLVDAHDDYSATRSGAVVTITGPVGEEFEIEGTASNVEGGTDDQTLVTATTQTAVAGVSEVLSTGTVTITGGSPNVAATGSVELTGGGSGSVDSITVDGVEIMSGVESFDTTLATTAANVAANITANTSSPDYTATADGAIITISADPDLGGAPDGFVVVSSATTITTSDTNMSGGSNNSVTSITVDGIEVLGAAVDWTVSNSALAANIATQIDSFTSSPEYTADADGNVITISAASGSGTAPNGRIVTVFTVGDVTGTDTDMAGGVAEVSGQAQISTATVGGTFEAGDRFTISLTKDGAEALFGAEGNPDIIGLTALTFKTKLYVTASSILFFSGVNDATVWNRDDPDVPGANFINMASQSEGSQDLVVAQVYQNFMAIFSRTTVQIWTIKSDEAQNEPLQTLEFTGTRSPRSALSYGNTDTFYYSDSGVRSLRARDSSNAAFVSDVGTAIDEHIKAYAKTLTDAQIEAAWAVLEPGDDRYWLAIGSRIYVFSYFPGSKISAWSYYDITDDLGGSVDVLARSAGTLYARAGDAVYVYGGANGDTYPDDDEIEAIIETPFFDAKTPATKKNLIGFDMASTGTWEVSILVDPNDTSKRLDVGTIHKITYPLGRASAVYPQATHFAVRAVCRKAGPATISNMAIHYQDLNEAG